MKKVGEKLERMVMKKNKALFVLSIMGTVCILTGCSSNSSLPAGDQTQNSTSSTGSTSSGTNSFNPATGDSTSTSTSTTSTSTTASSSGNAITGSAVTVANFMTQETSQANINTFLQQNPGIQSNNYSDTWGGFTTCPANSVAVGGCKGGANPDCLCPQDASGSSCTGLATNDLVCEALGNSADLANGGTPSPLQGSSSSATSTYWMAATTWMPLDCGVVAQNSVVTALCAGGKNTDCPSPAKAYANQNINWLEASSSGFTDRAGTSSAYNTQYDFVVGCSILQNTTVGTGSSCTVIQTNNSAESTALAYGATLQCPSQYALVKTCVSGSGNNCTGSDGNTYHVVLTCCPLSPTT